MTGLRPYRMSSAVEPTGSWDDPVNEILHLMRMMA